MRALRSGRTLFASIVVILSGALGTLWMLGIGKNSVLDDGDSAPAAATSSKPTLEERVKGPGEAEVAETPGVERIENESKVEIRIKSTDLDETPIEVIVVPIDSEWRTGLRRPYGVAIEDLERRAIRYATSGSEVLVIDRPSDLFCVGARAQGTSPAARLVEPHKSRVEIELAEGFPFRVAAFDHSNVRVPGVGFEVYFDSRTTLEKNPEADLAELAVLPLFRSTAQADGDAVATIGNLAPGLYRIVARHPSFAVGLCWGAIVPMTVDPFIVSLEPRAFVDGYVLDGQENKPIAGARVEIRELVNGQWYGDSCSVITDDSGYYACDNAWGSPLGDLDGRAICWKDGYGAQVVSYGFLRPGEKKRVDFSLRKGAVFRGRVEGIGGDPRSGVTVMALDADINIQTTTTRSDGSFALDVLAEGRSAYLHVSGPGVAPTFVTIPSPWPSESPFVIRVESTHAFDGLLVSDSYPLVDARVRASLEANRLDRVRVVWAEVDLDSGTFRFEELPPGRYYFDVMAKGFAARRIREIEIGSGISDSPLEITLERGCAVRGTVRDSATRKPLPGARIGLADFGEVDRSRLFGTIDVGVSTDESGQFIFEALERGRDAALTIELDGYSRVVDRFSVQSDATLVERSIDMIRGGRLRVVTTRPDSQPAGDFIVVAFGPSGNESRTSGSAVATVPGLEPGVHRVSVMLRDAVEDFRGSIRVFEDVVIREGEETILSANFAEGHAIRGRINGTVARQYSGGFGAYAHFLKDGRWVVREFCEVRRSDLGFAIFALEPGTYKVSVESLDRQPRLAAEQLVDLAPGVPCVLDFEFGDGVLEGVVSNSIGRPVVGAELSFVQESVSGTVVGTSAAAVSTATTASDGQFALAGLVAGPYRVRIDAEGHARHRDRIVFDAREPAPRQDFQLEPECRLRIEVVDRGGNVVAARTVKVLPSDSTAPSDEFDASRVDADGFTLVRGVGTGDYVLEVRAAGLFQHRSVIACVAGESRDVLVALRRFANLSVIARDVLGAPLKNAAFQLVDLETGEDVSMWIAAGRMASTMTLATDDKGALHIAGLPEGRYRVIGYGIDGEVDTTFDTDAKPTTLTAAQ